MEGGKPRNRWQLIEWFEEAISLPSDPEERQAALRANWGRAEAEAEGWPDDDGWSDD